MKVAVLGCGPTGLVAAHAATLYGAEVTIYSKARKSQMFGAQYLHQPIPYTEPGDPVDVDYILKGSIEDYRKKVYGPDFQGSVSPQDYEGKHEAYDIRQAYDFLWDAYKADIRDADIKPNLLAMILDGDGNYDHVISTIPLPAICLNKAHSFAGQDIWAMGDAEGQRVPFTAPENTVLCNGEESPSWYRVSNIFGHKTVEWAGTRKPPLPAAKVTKPLHNTCTCWPDIVRLGRYGMWQKGVLVHHAFMMAADLVRGDFSAAETRAHFLPCPMADPEVSAEVARQMGCRCG